MIVVSLLLILAAVALLALGLTGGSSALLIGSIVTSLLAAIALVIGARRAAARRQEAAGAGPSVVGGRSAAAGRFGAPGSSADPGFPGEAGRFDEADGFAEAGRFGEAGSPAERGRFAEAGSFAGTGSAASAERSSGAGRFAAFGRRRPDRDAASAPAGPEVPADAGSVGVADRRDGGVEGDLSGVDLAGDHPSQGYDDDLDQDVRGSGYDDPGRTDLDRGYDDPDRDHGDLRPGPAVLDDDEPPTAAFASPARAGGGHAEARATAQGEFPADDLPGESPDPGATSGPAGAGRSGPDWFDGGAARSGLGRVRDGDGRSVPGGPTDPDTESRFGADQGPGVTQAVHPDHLGDTGLAGAHDAWAAHPESDFSASDDRDPDYHRASSMIGAARSDAADDDWRDPGTPVPLEEFAEPDEEDPADEPLPQAVRPHDAVQVARLTEEVLVVDGRPRYHLADCPHLVGRLTEGLPASEAVELGFSPCGLCRPVDRLVARAARS